MFGVHKLKRHRLFEFGSKQDLILVSPCNHDKKIVSVFGHGGHIYHGVKEWREIMGIDWMTRDELAQAIPPAYTEFIGKHILKNFRSQSYNKNVCRTMHMQNIRSRRVLRSGQ
jgi:DNA (cytosine-5)-methyltransferase 1